MNIEYASTPAFLGDPGPFLGGEAFEIPDGTKDWAVRKSNGKILSVQPNGSYGERDAVGGSYERFKIDPKVNVLWVTPDQVTYAIPYRQA